MTAVCRADGTPVVMSFEVPGAEWHCMSCGGWFAFMFPEHRPISDDAGRLLSALTDRFRAGERGPIADLVTPPEVPPSAGHVKCEACAKDSGRTTERGKPPHWYQRSDAEGTQIVCSLDCINALTTLTGKRHMVSPW